MTDDKKRYEDAKRAFGVDPIKACDAQWHHFLLWRIAEALEVIADAQLEEAFKPEDGEDWKNEADEDE